MANEKWLINAYKLVIDLAKANKQGRLEYDDVLAVIASQKNEEAVEVVHAEWIDEYPYVRCSECNAEWINCRTDNEPKLFYYCPHCGAKMDGGNEDG